MKDKILMTAAEEMNQRGIKFTLDHVANRLGISKKTIYQYYSSKDVLITKIIDLALDDVQSQEHAILADEDRDFVQKLQDLMMLAPKKFGKTNDWVMEDIKRSCIIEWKRIEDFKYGRMLAISGLLEEGITLGIVQKINTEVAARLLIGACKELQQYDFLVENNLESIQVRQLLTDIFLYGILKERSSVRGVGKE